MSDDHVTWQDRYPDQVTCVRCLIVKEQSELDRLLWCEECRDVAQARALDIGWWVGAAVAGGLVAYIWLVIEPSRALMGAWVGVTLASFYLAARMTREVLYGMQRLRNARATEAVPPRMPPHAADSGEADGGSAGAGGGAGGDPEDDGPPRVNLRG